MPFVPKNWVDGAGGGTPITATELNRIETGIANLGDRVDPMDYGATGNGSANDTTALTNAIADLSPGDTLWIEAGKIYTHTTVLTVATDGVTITGGGEIRATAENTSAFVITGDHVLVEDITFTCPTTTQRWDTLTHQKLQLQNNVGCVLRRVTVDGSAAAGIFTYGASYFHVDGCEVKNTRADGYHNVKASHHGLFTHCDALNVGDDGFAAVSYATGVDAGQTHHIRFHHCKVINTASTNKGRMFAAVGSNDVEFEDCYGDGSYAAGLIVTTEISYATYSAARVFVRGMEIRNANTLAGPAGAPTRPDHGAVLVSCERDGTTITDVALRDIRVVDTDTAIATRELGIIETGTGTVDGIVLDNISMVSGPTQLFYTNAAASKYRLVDVKSSGSWGWELLGSVRLTAAAVSTGAITVPAHDILMITARVTGMSAGDIPALRFNADTANNYWSRHITAAAGGVTLTNTETVTTSMARLSGTSSGGARIINAFVQNMLGWQKIGTTQDGLASGAAGTAGVASVAGAFEWVNTTAQITSVELRTAGGSVTMNSGTELLIFGKSV